MNLKNRLRQLATNIKIIEMFNFYYALGIEKDIVLLKEKLEYLQTANSTEIKAELKNFCEKINEYIKIVPVEFIKGHHDYIRNTEKDFEENNNI